MVDDLTDMLAQFATDGERPLLRLVVRGMERLLGSIEDPVARSAKAAELMGPRGILFLQFMAARQR
jgi:hypothetical protein